MKIEVGQKVIIERIGDARRCCKQDEILEYAIVKEVKRKWFTLDKHGYTRFSLENGYNDSKGYSSNYKVIFDFENIEDLIEHRNKLSVINDFFKYNYTIDSKLCKDDIGEIYNIVNKVKK